MCNFNVLMQYINCWVLELNLALKVKFSVSLTCDTIGVSDKGLLGAELVLEVRYFGRLGSLSSEKHDLRKEAGCCPIETGDFVATAKGGSDAARG
ncbi:hypothetical protein MKW98_018507, partial [Papaver atlanticum]